MTLNQFDHVQISASRLLNALLGGNCNKMLSSRVYDDDIKWAVFFIDCIFFWEKEHCKACSEWEIQFMNGVCCEDNNGPE